VHTGLAFTFEQYLSLSRAQVGALTAEANRRK
jgi:hypothetical protein